MTLSVRQASAVVLVVVLGFSLRAAQQHAEPPQLQTLDQHRRQIIGTNTQFQDIFGPAPALASTPFLALAGITGAALLLDHPAVANSTWPVVRHLRGNAVIREARRYASWWLFGILVVLAATTFIANSGKIQGSVGKVARVAENVAVGLAYLVVVGAVCFGAVSTSAVDAKPPVLQAGFLPPLEIRKLALIVTAALAVTAMSIVRFAFDLLIWLNPIPLVDAVFEAVKTAFSVVFLVLYFLSPVAAAVVASIILIPCLLLLPWALRLLAFARRIVIYPILSRLVPALRPRLVDPVLAASISGAPTLACHASVLQSRGLKKRQSVALMQCGEDTMVIPIRRRVKTQALARSGERIVIGRALAWIELRVVGPDSKVLDQFALPYSLAYEYDSIRVLLSAHDEEHFGVMRALHSAGVVARQGVESATHAAKTWRSVH